MPAVPRAPHRHRLRLGCALLLAGCIGPQAGHREGYEGPTGPVPDVVTNVRGTVRDALTRAPLAGVVVRLDETHADTTRSDGNYTLQRLYLRAATIRATHDAYLPFQNAIALNGGERLFDILLQPAPAAAVATLPMR